MHLVDLLKQLAETLKLENLQLNEAGVCQLVIDDHLQISIEQSPAEDTVHFYSILGRVPETAQAEFYAGLLEAQLFFREIGEGCAFGLEKETQEILLNKKLSLGQLDLESFKEALNEFINWADHWKGRLGNPEVFQTAQPIADQAETSFYIRA